MSVKCKVSLADATNTVISGAGITETIAGVVTYFHVDLYDVGNNHLEVGGDTLDVSITPGPISAIEIFDLNNGTYSV